MRFILFDMTNIRILHTAPTSWELFPEENYPVGVRTFKVEGLDDSLFLGSPKYWTELNLRKLYTWLKIDPPLTPTKMEDAAILDLRVRTRASIARQLRLEPSALPTLEVPVAVINTTPSAPPPPRLPTASRGSVGPLIHRVATEMWEAAGSPTDIPTILKLRQTIMKTLNEEHKIKIATSSNELGRWQKGLVTVKIEEPHT